MLRNTVDARATSALMLFSFVYAVNNYTIASVYPSIPTGLSGGVSGLALITSAFYAGNGLALVPSGLLAARVGARRTIAFGTLLFSIAIGLTALSTALYQMVLLRFFVGVGMAAVVGPSFVLATRYFRAGSEGVAVGIMNAFYGIGGVVGLTVWAILGELVGWRVGIFLSGAAGLISALLLFLAVPGDVRRPEFMPRLSDLRKLMLNRLLLVFGSVFVSLTIGTGLFGYFIVLYLHDNLGIDTGTAGLIGGLWLAFVLVVSPFAGRAYGRPGNPKRVILFAVSVLTIGVALPATGSVYASVLGAAFVGLGAGSSYTLITSRIRELGRRESHEEYVSMAINWANAISYAGFWAPILFSYVVTMLGYAAGWLTGAVVTFIWVAPLLFMRRLGTDATTA